MQKIYFYIHYLDGRKQVKQKLTYKKAALNER